MTSNRPKPVVLCILDGFGYRADAENNAIAQADTPCLDALMKSAPHSLLRTDSEAVGLPRGQMGNSEVGHMTLGAGRVIWQDLPRIDNAIEKGELANNHDLKQLIADFAGTNKVCHLMGLLSTGGVHSHQNHFAALANLLAAADVNVTIHGFLDGRDRPPHGSKEDWPAFLTRIPSPKIKIGTIIGRYYAMDRDKRWDRVERAYDALVDGVGDRFADTMMGILTHHALDITDEFMDPLVNATYGGMHDNDAIIHVNFRADRARQMLAALVLPDFADFKRKRVIRFSHVLGMTDYGGATAGIVKPLFAQQNVVDTLPEVLARYDLKQLRMAETEKYAHVTYFFNGGRETPWPKEDRIVVPSPKVATYDLKPEMSAPELTDKLVDAIQNGGYDFILVNYANGDMVGHSGDLKAATAAVTALDQCLTRVTAAVNAVHGAMIVTADHGNCEEMWDAHSHSAHTQHSLNPVPCILVGGPAGAALNNGSLVDVAPTIIALMHLTQPADMTGKSLLK